MSTIKYNTFEFGSLLQQSNPDSIVSISWPYGDSIDTFQGPSFYFFRDLNHVITHLLKLYGQPFVLYDQNVERYTKESPIYEFNDEKLSLSITTYKYEGDTYTFYNDTIYSSLKSELLKYPHINIEQYLNKTQ